MRARMMAIGTVLALAACNQSANQNTNVQNAEQPANAAVNDAPPVIPPPGTGPNARTPLGEPKAAIDPKSPEAAAQVVQHYGALIEQKRWTEGWALWTNAGAARVFERNFRTWSDVHLEIGSPGDIEGAAGSLYVTVDAGFYGKLKNGAKVRGPAMVTLRRVNDVPGSTQEERRWHIERIDWQPN